MSGGGESGSNSNPNKIKGGRWTVAKFFSISVSYAQLFGGLLILQIQCHNLYYVALTSSRIASQLAFTMVWMLIISQLGYYKILYGPQVLLQMNIAYFLPSIPLLGLSSQFDERLDQKFGMLVIFTCR